MGDISAHDLVKQLRQSLGCERTALAELDRRRLYVELGFNSSWSFCCRALGLSEAATHYRLAAARQIQKQPELVEQIRNGRLCITTLAKLSPVLTDDNRAALVAEAAGKQILTETLLRKHLTVNAEFETLLAQARDALSHAMPGASEVEILTEGLRRIRAGCGPAQ